VLLAAQASTGGLRDKPGKNADAYHTLYNLAGLSSAQHHFLPSKSLHDSLLDQWNPETGEAAGDTVKLGSTGRDHALRKTVWVEMSSWVEDEHQPESQFVGGKANRLVSCIRTFEEDPLLLTAWNTECCPSNPYSDDDPLPWHTQPLLWPERHSLRLTASFTM